MSPRDEFPRTTCACDSCRIGCKTIPGPLAPGDLERIAEYKGVTDHDAVRQFAIDHFCASEGGKVALPVGTVLVVHSVPSVTPQQKSDGSCVFLDENERCTIHPVSPFGCSRYDIHMSQEDADARTRAVMLASMNSNGYKRLLEMLAAHGKVARPLKERKDAQWAGLQQIQERGN